MNCTHAMRPTLVRLRCLGVAAAIGLLLTQWGTPVGAQQPHDHPTETRPDSPDATPDREAHDEQAEAERDGAGAAMVPHAQRASGTAWQPASTPMYGHMWRAGSGRLMLHYLVFAGFDAQLGGRGSREAFSTNWAMLMARHPWLGGQFDARLMVSLEPLILGSDGYALLLQTGETSGGEPLVDRQHPHELFMEAALAYAHPLSHTLGFELYLAAAGEPALGPVAFPHRISAYADPMAPLSHHWQDSTHIAFGVLTAGVHSPHVKLEGSWFNGREPDEQRYDFDLRVPDSYAVRLAVNPTRDWSGQISYGYLEEPEFVLEPDQALHRLTASATYNEPLRNGGNWATTFAWGQNRGEDGHSSDALLVETNLLIGSSHVFGRAEHVLKGGHDFALEGPAEEEEFPISAVSLGYMYNFGPLGELVPGLGARVAVNSVPDSLAALYETSHPVGVVVYARLRPSAMEATHEH